MTPAQVALQYIGQTELPKNSGFTDKDFERKMREVGFNEGLAWCAFFTELVFKEAFPEKFFELDKLFSGSTIQTFENFQDEGYPISYAPRINNLVIWRSMKDGKPQPTGHAGIVVSVKDTWQFESVEGNTTGVTKSRDGYIVAKHERKVLADVQNGLKILGFIQI